MGISKYTKGKMYKIPKKEIPIKGVISNTLIFDKNGVLQALLLTFPEDHDKTYWNRLFNSLKKKYIFVESSFRYAMFESGDVVIKLESPQNGSKINLIYATKHFLNLFLQTKEREQKAMEDNL